MLERIRRPLDDDDRAILERHRQNAIGSFRFEAQYTFLAGAAGFVVGVLWLGLFHRGDRGTPFWAVLVVIAALVATGAAAGFAFDYFRARTARNEREADAAASWDPVIAVGIVEHLVAEASSAVRLDDDEGNTAWFLQVAENQMLCVWDWANNATERVEIDLVPGSSPTILNITWTGKQLTPSRPKRKFKRGERQPGECETLTGVLDDLDRLLREGQTPKPSPGPRTERSSSTPSSKLADEVEALGFYKYVALDQRSDSKAEIEGGAYQWYLAAERAFGADAERLAEGGVGDLLDYMRPALAIEGWTLGDIEQTYDAERGYTLRIDEHRWSMWAKTDGRSSWDLTMTRTVELINRGLADAGSDERVHILYGGEDAVFVLLTPVMLETIARSGVFGSKDLPALL
jgi:hypothetical protein